MGTTIVKHILLSTYTIEGKLMSQPPVKLLDQVRSRIRLKGYSIRSEKSYVEWIRRFILFHKKHHPKEMGRAEIEHFLSHLVVQKNVASSTQNQAFNAILFLYDQVLELKMQEEIQSIRSKKPVRVPTVMPHDEIHGMIAAMNGVHQLMAKKMYGCGLRVLECLRMRVKDIDFALNQVIVRDGKGKKDRITVLPDGIKSDIEIYLQYARRIHQEDLRHGFGRVYLPNALDRKYSSADRQWGWQYVFPSKTPSIGPRSGIKRRHHMHENSIRKAISRAAKISGIIKPVGCHTLRHSFVPHLLMDGHDIRTVQELLGHKDVSPTMVYTHVLNRGGRGVVSLSDFHSKQGMVPRR
ncbi:MAG: integron integrase [Desulfobacteraceae bacterium]